ncbi:hypothetical protein GOP47_0005458 [Adiantum capillus-veneris]|uniref:Uncharacterized protein n=1 Tax=Adiantum capillus-veneris TaxID=13818 RepID=A0A9D4V559_ADICA|nr:hypothetical protein GOP47_0005458 [Adiantum capillus-veneris]
MGTSFGGKIYAQSTCGREDETDLDEIDQACRLLFVIDEAQEAFFVPLSPSWSVCRDTIIIELKHHQALFLFQVNGHSKGSLRLTQGDFPTVEIDHGYTGYEGHAKSFKSFMNIFIWQDVSQKILKIPAPALAPERSRIIMKNWQVQARPVACRVKIFDKADQLLKKLSCNFSSSLEFGFARAWLLGKLSDLNDIRNSHDQPIVGKSDLMGFQGKLAMGTLKVALGNSGM